MTSAPKRTLDDALDSLAEGSGTVSVDAEGGQAEVDVVEAGKIGVRVKEVRIRRDHPVDVSKEASRLPERLLSLPDPVEPVEVAPELGGATLRSKPRDGRYFEVGLEPSRTNIRRTRVDDDGKRHDADWTMTRDQLDRLIDEATEPVEAPGESSPPDES